MRSKSKRPMIEKVRDCIEKFDMLRFGDSVIVALSGGADSVALLLLLQELSVQYGISLSACHVNHHLRGKESDGDAAFCQNLCERLGISLTIFDVDVISYCKTHKTSIELGARQLRYECFATLAQRGERIATAHTLSDSLETVLFNLARGTSLEGLCGIAPVRNNIIRPLLFLSRGEIEAYLANKQQPFVVDSTNSDDSYSRNHIRKNIIPQLRRLNPSLEQSVARMLVLNRQDNIYLNNLASQLLHSFKTQRGLDANRLSFEDRCMQGRVLTQFLKENGLPYDYEKVCLLQEILAFEGAVSFTADKCVIIKNGLLRIEQTAVKITQEGFVNTATFEPDSVEIAGKTLKIIPLKSKEIKFFVNNSQNEFKNCLDCDKLKELLIVRTRRDGDSFTPYNRGCTKSVKKLMNEAKMPLFERARALLLWDGEIIWIEGFGASSRVSISSTTKHAIRIQIIQEENSNA